MGCSKIHGGLAAQAGYPIELSSSRGIDFQSIKSNQLLLSYSTCFLWFSSFTMFPSECGCSSHLISSILARFSLLQPAIEGSFFGLVGLELWDGV